MTRRLTPVPKGLMLAFFALASLACRAKVGPGREAPSAPSAAPASSAARNPPAALVVSGVAEVPGLRVTTGSIAGASLWGFSDLAVDLGRVELQIVRAARGALLPELLPPGALAIVNGGYFEADFRPSTWLKSGGTELAPQVDTSRGGLLAVAPGRSYVGAFSGLGFEPELAVQSFPLIVEAEGKPGIHRDDGRRAARTVVCSRPGALHFVVIAAPRGEGPTLFEADELLRRPVPTGFGCQVALNLDGGPSSGVAFGPALAAKQRIPIAPVAYGIALRSRAEQRSPAGSE